MQSAVLAVRCWPSVGVRPLHAGIVSNQLQVRSFGLLGWPWMTVNGQNALFCKVRLLEATAQIGRQMATKWMTLNDLEWILAVKNPFSTSTIAANLRLLDPIAQIWMKIDPYNQRQKCRPMIPVSGNMFYGDIRALYRPMWHHVDVNYEPINAE